MEILRLVVLIVHLLAFGALFGVALANIGAAKGGKGRVTGGLFHSALTMLVTGIILVGLFYAMGNGDAVNNAKITVKTVVVLAIAIWVFINRKKTDLKPGFFGGVAGLAALNAILAVAW